MSARTGDKAVANKALRFVVAAACLLAAAPALARISDQEAARLGADLTPVGAIKAGNADGSIPAWDGGITAMLPGTIPGISEPNPYPGDKPLFRINAANLAQYRDRLTPGAVAMLERYPETYYMNIYPTRRSAALPAEVYARIKAQATRAELVDDGNGIDNLGLSTVPFPMPRTGQEAIWNHLVRYRGNTLNRIMTQSVVQGDGSFLPVVINDLFAFKSSLPDTAENANNLFFAIQNVLAPQRLAGTVLLVVDKINVVKEPRQSWVYNSGQRRVLRAPEVAYDNPGTAADGARTTDNYDMFNGAIDRYDWKLVGRKEFYVPYNANLLDSRGNTYKDILKPAHMNPDLLRFELHRVWVVEATLKPDLRHVYARRVFYLDEDSWSALAVDHYDGRGALWRVAEGHLMQFSQDTVPFYTTEVLYDLHDDRYLTLGLNNEEKSDIDFTWQPEEGYFTPSNLRRIAK